VLGRSSRTNNAVGAEVLNSRIPNHPTQ